MKNEKRALISRLRGEPGGMSGTTMMCVWLTAPYAAVRCTVSTPPARAASCGLPGYAVIDTVFGKFSL